MNEIRGAVSAGLLGALVAVTATIVPSGTASAASPSSWTAVPAADEEMVTWAVEPADESGPDGRRWIERTLDPGATVTEHLAVRNLGTVSATFSLTAADGYLTNDGKYTILPDTEPSVDGGTWITVQESVEVPAGQTRVVPVEIAVPDNATPGDHLAGVAASVLSTGENGMQVVSRVGFRVMMRVSGEVEPRLSVTDVRISYEPTWNPFAAGRARIEYTVENTGNIRVGAAPSVTADSLVGTSSAEGTPIDELLPGDSLDQEVEVDGVWPFGRVSTTVTAALVEVGPEGEDTGSAGQASFTGTAAVGVVPWPQIGVLALLVVGVIAVLGFRRSLRNRLAEARAQGRVEAQS